MCIFNDGGKLRGKALYEKLRKEQLAWIAERGNDKQGYRDYYCGRFGKTKLYADAVFAADVDELQRLDELLGL